VCDYADPGGWVRRVALNAATSAWRRRKNEAVASVRLGATTSVPTPLTERDERVWAAVRRLPRRQSQVMILIAVEDSTVAGVATILGIGENSVRTHLRRARETLARDLSLEEQEPGS
jgi:RNA polymerase sigma-70 factor (ECF subfamily)